MPPLPRGMGRLSEGSRNLSRPDPKGPTVPIARSSSRLVAALLALVLGLVVLAGPASPSSAQAPTDPAAPTGRSTPADPEGRIIGGSKSPAGAWPSVVALMRTDPWDDYTYQVCGGTIIDPSWVLTAAHCVSEGPRWVESPRDFHVLVGTQNLASGGQRIQVAEIIVRPSYNPERLSDDVALIRLARPTDRARPLEVASPTDIPWSGANVTAVGWGVTDLQTYDQPDEMRQVDLPAMSGAECQAAISEIEDDLYIPSYHSSHLCAGDLGAGGEGPCYGDSGGPLVWETGGRKIIVGLSSWVPNYCASPEGPSVFSKVASASRWIEQTIKYGPHYGPEDLYYSVGFAYQDNALLNGFEPTVIPDIADPPAHIAGYHAKREVTHRDGTIVRLYSTILGRRAESHGYQYWRERLTYFGNISLTRVAEVMTKSAEFRTTYGSLDDESFVEQLYLNVLGRPGAPADVDYWEGRLANGESRGKVALLITESGENKARTKAEVDVQVMFLNLIGRAPAGYEIDQWETEPLRDLAHFLLHSVAYARRYGGYYEYG
jgi:secreted trypsin-like serine protease